VCDLQHRPVCQWRGFLNFLLVADDVLQLTGEYMEARHQSGVGGLIGLNVGPEPDRLSSERLKQKDGAAVK